MPKKTLNLPLSDSAIRKHAVDLNVSTLNDPRHPVRFRYRNDRSRGSWHVVRFVEGKTRWRKAANWPDVPAKTFLEQLPAVHARLLGDPAATASVGCCRDVVQVLTWFYARLESGQVLSRSRRGSALSAIRMHLRPRLEGVQVAELTAGTVDRLLVWPMLEQYKPAYVRSVLGVLKVAFSSALDLQQITVNPIAAVTFSKSTKVKIRPKGARLRHVAVVDLLDAWATAFTTQSQGIALAVMMLAHGSRISETRQARWKNVSLTAGEWFIPAADTKSKRDHILPLTPQAVAFLTRYRSVQQAQGYDGAYLFPDAARSGRPMSRSHSFAVFKGLGAGEWTSHDLRKLARTTWGELAVDSVVAKLLLNHQLTDLEATYFQTHGPHLKRKALEAWHGWLDAQGFDLLQGETVLRRPAKRVAVDPAGWLA